MCFLQWKLILTKDNLTKLNWIGNETCCYVVFAITRNPYNIFSLSVPLLRLYGASYI
jgi:hypothetical protein